MMKKESKRVTEKLANNERAALALNSLVRRSKETLKNRKRIPPEERVHYSIELGWLSAVEELSGHIDSYVKKLRRGQTGTLDAEEEEIRRLLKNIHELGGYVEPDASIEERDEWVEHTMNFMRELGVSWNALKTTEANLKSRGRPPAQRRIAMAARGLRLESPQPTWSELAERFWLCEKETHDFHCGESIRKGVGKLKKVLERYEISLP